MQVQILETFLILQPGGGVPQGMRVQILEPFLTVEPNKEVAATFNVLMFWELFLGCLSYFGRF